MVGLCQRRGTLHGHDPAELSPVFRQGDATTITITKMQLYSGTGISRHTVVGDAAVASAELLNDLSQFVVAGAPDPPGPHAGTNLDGRVGVPDRALPAMKQARGRVAT